MKIQQCGASRSARSQIRGWKADGGLKGGKKASIGARVGVAASSTPEAVSSEAAKNEATQPGKTRSSADRVKKRAYMRALRRAAREGQASYRGRIIYVRREFIPTIAATPVSKPRGPRTEIFSWNCSGLSEELYQELLCWMGTQPNLSVVMLQENALGFHE